MEASTIAKLIQSLGIQDFRAVSRLVAERISQGPVIHVDGPYDGGSDWSSVSQADTRVAIQDTVQTSDIDSKITADAIKAKNRVSATYFYFICSQPIANAKRLRLQRHAAEKSGIGVTLLGANDIADFIVDAKLAGKLGKILRLPTQDDFHLLDEWPVQTKSVYTHLLMSSESAYLKEKIFQDSILLAFKIAGEPISLTEAKELSRDVLPTDDIHGDSIQSALDSLLGRGLIKRSENDLFSLSDEASADLQLAEIAYQRDFQDFVDKTKLTISSFTNTEPSSSSIKILAQRLAEFTIFTSMSSIIGSGLVDMVEDESFRRLRDSQHRLNNEIQTINGLSPSSIDTVTRTLVELAASQRFISRLMNSTFFFYTQGTSPLFRAKSLGSPTSWRDVSSYMDASVAIPFLCCNMFEPTSGRYSRFSYEVIQRLKRFGSKIYIMDLYINECAAHLAQAIELDAQVGSLKMLAHSTNGWTAHFNQLRNESADAPASLAEYIGALSQNALHLGSDRKSWIQRIESDLRGAFLSSGIEIATANVPRSEFAKQIEVSYLSNTHSPAHAKSDRADIVVRHDVKALSYMAYLVTLRRHPILVTWDAAMIKTGRELHPNCGWCIAPSTLTDFIAGGAVMDDVSLVESIHMLASVDEKPLETAASIIEGVVRATDQKVPKWKLQSKIKELEISFLSRISTDRQGFTEWASQRGRTVIEEILEED